MSEALQHLVQRLVRPIEFASRDGFARLPHVTNLGPFVSRQVVTALADQVYPTSIETQLLVLQQLFRDFDARLAIPERRRRLKNAEAILTRLRGMSSQVVAAPAKRVTRTSAAQPQPAAPPVPLLWKEPIQFVRGVGPKRALLLEKLGISTIEDALWTLPWRYEDRSHIVPICELAPGMRSAVCGLVQDCRTTRTARRGLSVLDVTVDDSTGQLHAVFFNQPYLERVLSKDVRVMLCGLVVAGRRGWTDLQMESPQYEVVGDEAEAAIHVGRIVPIYHETKGLTSRYLRAMVRGLIDRYLDGAADMLPPSLCVRQRLIPFTTAVADVHFPPQGSDLAALDRGTSAGHRRLAFEEFFVLQLGLAAQQRTVKEEHKSFRFLTRTPLLLKLQADLPFRLTASQQAVLADIQRDMASPKPMNRLMQGDVGCGKTIVAVHAMVIASGSGYQAALMAPTEILAEQHYLSLRQLLERVGLRTVLLSGGGSAKARKETIRQIETGEAQIVVGTHAVIQKGVRFATLGLAVIDEQHKFGVLQRKTLAEKGPRPDVLVLTATPIPRTLAMIVYGDLDVSVIGQLPPGRRPVRTFLFDEADRRKAYRIIRDEVSAGGQAYIVFPLVEESDKLDLQAVVQAAERLRERELSGLEIAVLHGRMKSREKEQVMASFKSGAIQVLVASTVIEVGVDVPNATVMLVEHADRFGLAQLHQLRGRVGRGARQSYCLLVSSVATEPARERLEALVRSSDGFKIADEDLRLRGPGELLGTRQWGMPEFRAANLIRDVAILDQARKEAFALLRADPHLSAPQHQSLREAMLRRWGAKLGLARIS